MVTDAQGNTVDIYTLLAQLKASHPEIFGVLNKPGVAKVVMDLLQAESDGHPWTTAQLNAAYQATPYYQQTTEQQRGWDKLQATDPATAGQHVADVKQIIDNLQTQLGVTLSTVGGLNSDGFKFLMEAVQKDWTPDQIKYNLIARAHGTGGGDIGAMAADIKRQFNDYGVPISDSAVLGWANKLASGAIDAQSVLGYMQQQAKSMFPGLSDAISRGFTVRQIADPYLQIAGQELGINTATASLTDPKWASALTGNMNLADWTQKIRTDPAFGYDQTPQAATQAASFASQLARMMGATG